MSNVVANSYMNPHVIVLDAVRDQAFLKEQRADPVIKAVLKPGDRVVVCAHCDFVFLEETWEAINGRIFGHGTDSVPHLPATEIGPIHFGRRADVRMPLEQPYANDLSENWNEATASPSDNGAPAAPVYANVNASAETMQGATTAPSGNAAATDQLFTNTNDWAQTARRAATAANNNPATGHQAYANSGAAESEYRAASASSNNTASTNWAYENRDGAAEPGRHAAGSATPNPVSAPNVPLVHPPLRLREIPFQLREIPFAFREVGGY